MGNIDLIRKICARKTGVGADGLILLQPDLKYDFRMRHYNPDGSEAEMCGNGARSIIKYAQFLKIIKKKTVFVSMLDVHEGIIDGSVIKIKMNRPKNVIIKKTVQIDKRTESGCYLEIGVPHFVIFKQELQNLNVSGLGQLVAHHPGFPKGTNVNFININKKAQIDLRTYERGVESETLSCGTGATASAIFAHMLKKVVSPVMVNVPGGCLKIDFDNEYKNIWLSGPAEEVYRGELKI